MKARSLFCYGVITTLLAVLAFQSPAMADGSTTVTTATRNAAVAAPNRTQYHLAGTATGFEGEVYTIRIEIVNGAGMKIDAITRTYTKRTSPSDWSICWNGVNGGVAYRLFYIDTPGKSAKLADVEGSLEETTDVCAPSVPSVSEWGLMIMALFVLTAGTIVIRWQRRSAAV